MVLSGGAWPAPPLAKIRLGRWVVCMVVPNCVVAEAVDVVVAGRSGRWVLMGEGVTEEARALVPQAATAADRRVQALVVVGARDGGHRNVGPSVPMHSNHIVEEVGRDVKAWCWLTLEGAGGVWLGLVGD